MSYRIFLKEIEKGLPAPVYLLHTADQFFSREAVEAIKKFVPETERDFNLHFFDFFAPADEAPSVEEIIDTANTVSFFGSRRYTGEAPVRELGSFADDARAVPGEDQGLAEWDVGLQETYRRGPGFEERRDVTFGGAED